MLLHLTSDSRSQLVHVQQSTVDGKAAANQLFPKPYHSRGIDIQLLQELYGFKEGLHITVLFDASILNNDNLFTIL